jgi:hypothetical protein
VVQNRTFKYEVMVCVEGRWLIEAVGEDKDAAVATARRVLASGKPSQVRVIQQRFMPTGTMTESIILDEKATAQAERPVSVSAVPDDVALCETLDDLYGPPGRRTIGQVLREYCTKQAVTPTELLHGWSHQRKLVDAGGLLLAAVHRIGSAQAQKHALPAKERLNLLDKLIGEVMTRARDFTVERKKLPSFDGQDLGAFSRAIAAAAPQQHDFVLRSILTIHIFEQRSLLGKLELLLALTGLEEPGAGAVVDGMVADIVGFAEIIQELFGAQRNLAGFLGELSDLLLNRPTAMALCRNQTLLEIMTRVHGGWLPQTREVLVERLLRELASEKPLDKLDPKGDQRLLEQLVGRMTADNGDLLGGDRGKAALEYRRAVLRQKFLRESGLGSIADNMRMPKRF